MSWFITILAPQALIKQMIAKQNNSGYYRTQNTTIRTLHQNLQLNVSFAKRPGNLIQWWPTTLKNLMESTLVNHGTLPQRANDGLTWLNTKEQTFYYKFVLTLYCLQLLAILAGKLGRGATQTLSVFSIKQFYLYRGMIDNHVYIWQVAALLQWHLWNMNTKLTK